MKESFWGYWIIVLGIFVVIIMMLVSNVTTTNTQDYYLIKDVTEASLVDAVDYSYYRRFKELRINREKFVENFLRRFSESVSLNTYTIEFYDIYEAPPKASVKVTSKSGSFMVNGDSESFDIVNKVDAVLETSGTASSVGSKTASYEENSYSNTDKNDFNGVDKDESDTVVPYDPNVNRIPTVPQIGYIVATSWYQNTFMDCSRYGSCTLKSYYIEHKDEFVDIVTANWQREHGISFTASEVEKFKEVVRYAFTSKW